MTTGGCYGAFGAGTMNTMLTLGTLGTLGTMKETIKGLTPIVFIATPPKAP